MPPSQEKFPKEPQASILLPISLPIYLFHRRRRATASHISLRRQILRSIRIAGIAHDKLAVFLRQSSDVGTQRSLLVHGAKYDRPKRRTESQPAQDCYQLFGIGRMRLANRFSYRHDHRITEHGTRGRRRAGGGRGGG